MEITIQDFSLESAFNRLQEEVKGQGLEGKAPNNPEEYINVTSVEEVNIDKFEGLGVIFATEVTAPGENANDVKSAVKNIPTAGAKKYKTCYLGVFDKEDSHDVVPNSSKETKGECVDHCRQVCTETGRSIYVIIGKKADGFDRCQSEITYKPSKNQTYGAYKFVW